MTALLLALMSSAGIAAGPVTAYVEHPHGGHPHAHRAARPGARARRKPKPRVQPRPTRAAAPAPAATASPAGPVIAEPSSDATPATTVAALPAPAPVAAPHAATVNAIDRNNGSFAFTLSTARVAAGQVAFSLVDRDAAPHNLSVRFADGRTLSVADAAGGAAVTGSATLPAGTYTLFCAIDAHEQAGMRATLTVVP